MSLNVDLIQKLKRIHQRDERLISGYVRLNALMIIPYGIIQICIAYFIHLEEWDINNKGKFLEISGMHNEICECINPTTTASNNYQSVLGINKIDSGKHHWKFKITKLDEIFAYCRILIGVIKINKINEEQLKTIIDSYISCHDHYFGVGTNVSCKSIDIALINPDQTGNFMDIDYGIKDKPIKVGDIIDMYLDLDNLKMSFGVNGVNYGSAYDNMEKTEYKMGITLSRIGTAIELLSYHEVDEIPEKK